MGHYRSEMLPDATLKASALHKKFIEVQTRLKNASVGRWNMQEFDEARELASRRYERHEFNDNLLGRVCTRMIQEMEVLISKATS